MRTARLRRAIVRTAAAPTAAGSEGRRGGEGRSAKSTAAKSECAKWGGANVPTAAAAKSKCANCDGANVRTAAAARSECAIAAERTAAESEGRRGREGRERTPLSAHNIAQRVVPVIAVACRVQASPAMALAIETAAVRRTAMIVPIWSRGARIRIREPLMIAHDILRWLR